MYQSPTIFNFNDGSDDDELNDKVIIQLKSEIIEINYYQLLKWSKLIRDQYPKKDINKLSDDLKHYQQVFNLKEENIKSFFKSISDEQVQITNDQYFDYQKLSKIFKIPKFEKILKKYSQNLINDVDFIIKLRKTKYPLKITILKKYYAK